MADCALNVDRSTTQFLEYQYTYIYIL
ncbi:uncharacterized protein G2W53_022636 [Senna tora]|uniref:Uncharacterized protein n=1 Tax=Senna tora TaxID=362788 RepID=A0A834TN09_9FABA|nr:uncharacterized protein G2W53_022636 [Senna tora]